ncbi:Dabb family protein [Paenibacillus ginsengihumi]|jgi:quinol monooxygenase YgiN|uniref:Dabb family protein n=1 Tax=Paenibacillus ginsengihumi TaxID=431596 RepID=UPI00035DB153|nr:Dabb family protein [Paenibacillus ginsengihumi]
MSSRIVHQVAFRLRPDVAAGSFLADSKSVLSAIPGVERFAVYRQVSAKNDYEYVFSMEFADQSAYDAYNAHPDHVRYVAEKWKTCVSDFLEIDTKEYA